MLEELVIEPGRGFKGYWRDIWWYRELFYLSHGGISESVISKPLLGSPGLLLGLS